MRACGFLPRSARELEDGAQGRLEKLYEIIGQCRYGIHDLSRTEPDPVHGLPRFNMPLELGLFLGARRYGGAEQGGKRALILDVELFRYQRFASDLSGLDIQAHGGEPREAVRRTRDFLANVSKRALPGAGRVVAAYEEFVEARDALADLLEVDRYETPYVDFDRMVATWLLEAAEPEGG